MKRNLSNKRNVALVTGAGRGVGRAIALALARDGIDCILCSRKRDALGSVAKEIEVLGVKAYISSLDAVDSDTVTGLFQTVIRPIGRLDILVNNIGGVQKFSDFFGLSDHDWRDSFSLNFMTMVRFCREAIPWLRKSSRARIVNISSVAARQPGLYNPHYSSMKAAMIHLSKHLSNVLAKDNILVNTICPSTLAGGGWEKNIQDRAQREQISFVQAEARMTEEEQKKVPLRRMGSLADVASLVTFLASEQANFITGTCIDVDGGTVRSML